MSLRRNTALGPEILSYYNLTNQAGFGKAQIWILLACCFLAMHVFAELMGMAIIAPASQCDFKMDDRKKSILHGIAFLGVILSSYYWNMLSDLKGRKRVLLLSSLLAILLSLTSSLMSSYRSFLILRFLVGIFIAGPSFSAVTYLVEFCPFRLRHIVINYMAMFNGVGMIYCPGLAELLLCCDWVYDLHFITYRPWRFLMSLYTLPGIAGLLLMLKLPESPEFLLCSHKMDEAKNVLHWIHRHNTGELVELGELSEVNCGRTEVVRNGRLLSMESLPRFQKDFLLPFSLSCFVMFALCSVGNGLGIWFTDLRNRQTYETKGEYGGKTICEEMFISAQGESYDSEYECNDRVRTYRDSIYLGIGFLVAFNVFGLLLQWISQKYILITSTIVCGSSGICLLLCSHKTVTLTAFILFLAIPNVLMNLVVSRVIAFTSTQSRSKIVCICYTLGRIGAVQGSIVVGFFINSHCDLVFLSFTLLMFIASITSFILYRILEKTQVTP